MTPVFHFLRITEFLIEATIGVRQAFYEFSAFDCFLGGLTEHYSACLLRVLVKSAYFQETIVKVILETGQIHVNIHSLVPWNTKGCFMYSSDINLFLCWG